MESNLQQLLSSLGRWVARGALALAVITFLIQWLLPRVRKWYRLQANSHTRPGSQENNSPDGSEEQKKRQDSVRTELQTKHSYKASEFRERILRPREELKKQQKEDEFYKFSGHAWKGSGEALGTDESQLTQQMELDQFEPHLSAGEMSAIRRRIQEPTPQPPKPPERPKRVITLASEPEQHEADCVLVLLRSPLQTVYQRRFRQSQTVQELLDFMSVSGFSQGYNTLCTSYPRRDLAKDRDSTLQDLDFKGRVTLNIEELEL